MVCTNVSCTVQPHQAEQEYNLENEVLNVKKKIYEINLKFKPDTILYELSLKEMNDQLKNLCMYLQMYEYVVIFNSVYKPG